MKSAVAAPERIERPTGWRPHYVDIEVTVSTAFAWRDAPRPEPAMDGLRSPAPRASGSRARRRALRATAWDLGSHHLCDLELLVNGAFTPLGGFMGRTDYERVLRAPNATVALGNGVNAGRLTNSSFLLITVEPFGVLLHSRKEIGDEDAAGSGDSVND